MCFLWRSFQYLRHLDRGLSSKFSSTVFTLMRLRVKRSRGHCTPDQASPAGGPRGCRERRISSISIVTPSMIFSKGFWPEEPYEIIFSNKTYENEPSVTPIRHFLNLQWLAGVTCNFFSEVTVSEKMSHRSALQLFALLCMPWLCICIALLCIALNC